MFAQTLFIESFERVLFPKIYVRLCFVKKGNRNMACFNYSIYILNIQCPATQLSKRKQSQALYLLIYIYTLRAETWTLFK